MRRVALSLSSAFAIVALTAFDAPSAPEAQPSAEFRKYLDAADRAFAEGAYLAAVSQLRDGMQVANDALRSSILAAMPTPPAGFVAVSMPEPNVNRADPLTAGLVTSTSRPIERRFQSHDGASTLRMVVAPNAPSVAIVQQQLRQAEGDERFVPIVIGGQAGVLVRSYNGASVRFAIKDRHLLEIQAVAVDEEVLGQIVDQRALEKLAAALGQ